jgi:hypothetical protein
VPHGLSLSFQHAEAALILDIESVIDGILHAELRDRMILLRGQFFLNMYMRETWCNDSFNSDRYDIVECLLDFRSAVTIHGDDVLVHSNWEVGEKFLRKYGYDY